MARIACCYNCAYSYLDAEHTLACLEVGLLNWPACANHPDSLGRMRRTPQRGICPNYRPRLPKPEGHVLQIPLGDSYYAYVDATDYEWLSQWRWHTQGGYAVRYESKKLVFMHRQIAQPPKGKIVDHKNRNKLDNTRDNLRVCTHQENTQNAGKVQGTYSRFKGVSYRKERNKYFAQIYYKGEQYYLGLYADEIDAAKAYDLAAVALFGEFARVNFPEEWPPARRRKVYAQRDAVLRRFKQRRAKIRARRAKARSRRTEARVRRTEPKRQRTTRGGRSQAATAGKPNRRTHDTERGASPARATGHEPRVTRKSRAETRGRRSQERETASRKPEHKTHNKTPSTHGSQDMIPEGEEERMTADAARIEDTHGTPRE